MQNGKRMYQNPHLKIIIAHHLTVILVLTPLLHWEEEEVMQGLVRCVHFVTLLLIINHHFE